jgi:hypothetical protein
MPAAEPQRGASRCRHERGVAAPREDRIREAAMPERHGDQIIETKTEARQGVTGHNVRYVLLLSTGGVIAAFAIVYVLFFA